MKEYFHQSQTHLNSLMIAYYNHLIIQNMNKLFYFRIIIVYRLIIISHKRISDQSLNLTRIAYNKFYKFLLIIINVNRNHRTNK